MGQEDTCGVCGGHYRSCPHYTKTHVARAGGGLTLCGREVAAVMTHTLREFRTLDVDPVDWCRLCRRTAKKPRGIGPAK